MDRSNPHLPLAYVRVMGGRRAVLRALVARVDYAVHGAGHFTAPCWEQPGKQEWHTSCAIAHPFRFLRSRGPRRWRYQGGMLA
jgi:hypothetical protein